MKITHIAYIAVAAALMSEPALARSGLTQGQASAKHALAQYGYGEVDVTTLNSSQLAQIHYLVGSSSGTGRIRGQIGAILRQSHIWNLTRKDMR
jgi:hypothetical protein